MLAAYKLGEKGPEAVPAAADDVAIVADWIDLFQPSPAEERAAELFLGAPIPTREETQEIEFSSRFYAEDGAIYMTATVLTGVEVSAPVLTPFTIVVSGERIATLRYEELRAFKQFMARATKATGGCQNSPGVFLGLIEAIIDRTADVLERIGVDVDRLNREIFDRRPGSRQRGRKLALLMGDIGVQGDLTAKTRESLASLERLVQFANLTLSKGYTKGGNAGRLKLSGRDIRSLEDQVTFMSNKINFLLDATLGLISTEQNEVIRILTVAATVLFPPMLIGTVYGMNFHDMPELNWWFGYPLALILMVLSAVIPYYMFKRRGWL